MESPRWLLLKGRTADALAVLRSTHPSQGSHPRSRGSGSLGDGEVSEVERAELRSGGRGLGDLPGKGSACHLKLRVGGNRGNLLSCEQRRVRRRPTLTCSEAASSSSASPWSPSPSSSAASWVRTAEPSSPKPLPKASFTGYVFVFNVENLLGNIYLNFALLGLLNVVAAIFLSAADRFFYLGRRLVHQVSMIGVSCSRVHMGAA